MNSTTRRLWLMALAVLAPLSVPHLVEAQIPTTPQAQQQQLQRMQEQMHRLDEAARRMTHIHERAHALEQHMLMQMEHLRAQEHLMAEEQHRLRQQEQVHAMAHALSGAAGEMTQAMMGLRQMAQNASSGVDREVEREMERLRATMEQTLNQMEDGLRALERLRDRLSQT